MFKDPLKEDAYRIALTMHETLSKEGSGRGMAYRKGWNGDPYDKSWSSYPIYAAGRTNRRRIGGAALLPVGTTHFSNQERKP